MGNGGGPTQTEVPLSGSPAIDAGPSGAACSGTDQRGVLRPQGAACDIGTVEVDTTAPVVTVSFPPPPSGQHGYFNASQVLQVPVAGTVTATDSGNIASLDCTGASLSQQTGLGATSASATLTNANLTKTNLKGATGMSSATLTGVIWSKTTCPDGTLSSQDGGTCLGHF